MTDMEKVIKALEYCRNQSGCWSDVSECPWIAECRENVNSLKDATLALLKQHEPEWIEEAQKMNGKKIHELKILPEYFDAVRCGDKRFEIRKNDRNFHRGDILRLKEFDGKEYTGEEIDALVRYVLYDWTGGLQDGYCIMSIDTMMHSIPRQEGR